MKNGFEVALFGAGRIGKVHAGNIVAHPKTTLRYLVEPVDDVAERLIATTNAERVTAETALGEPSIAAIVICSDTNTHADLIEQGLAANKAVFCEKPIDLDIRRVSELLQNIENHTFPLRIGFNRRFDPGVMKVKESAVSGKLGNVELVSVISKDPAGALPIDYLKISGGLFRDMTIHDFDMARHLLGEEVASVSATATSLVSSEIAEIGDVDTAAVTLQTASGKIAVITNSRRCTSGYDQRIEVHGSLGTARTDNVPKSMFSVATKDGTNRDNPRVFFTDRYVEAFVGQWDRFVETLEGSQGDYPSGDDGYKALLLAEAAYISLEERRTVTISETKQLLLGD